MPTKYFDSSTPRVLAHRGLCDGKFDENSAEALSNAVAHGIEYLEIDVRASSDSVAFVLHDADLRRVAGISKKVSHCSSAELDEIALSRGGRPLRLESALNLFPTAHLNIDIKSADVIAPVRELLADEQVRSRVLITSFSDRRRRATVNGYDVATSAGWLTTLLARLAYRVPALLGFLLRDVNALQIPRSFQFLRFDKPEFVKAIFQLGVEVHFWVINDVAEAKRLVALGASGIVTDSAHLIAGALAE